MALVQGTDNSDDIVGTSGADLISGFGGNDTITGGAGDDGINGGDGLDWVLFPGSINEYRIDVPPGRVGVNDLFFDQGNDSLVNVERIQFDDMAVAFDLFGNAGAAARLIGTLFDGASVYNPAYMQVILYAFDQGYSAEQIAAAAIDYVYPDYTDAELGALIFFNLAGRAGSDAEVADVTDLITTYGDTAVVVAAGDTSYNEENIDFAGLVANGVEFLPTI